MAVDLIAACRVFVHVAERSSFTLGAAAARTPQSVASRRIAALEKHFGARLFDRSARRAVLTEFGRDMLSVAKRLVQLAEAMEDHAEQAKLRPLSLALPDICSVRQRALLDAAAREAGTVLEFRTGGPAERAELLRSREVRAALVAVPPGEADWVVPLGVASTADDTGAAPLQLGTLRFTRAQPVPVWQRLWIQPEDDVPHVRDRIQQLGHRNALLPAQIAVAASLIEAVSGVLRDGGLLLCPAAQARELELSWRPLAGAPIARGFKLSAATGEDAQRIHTQLRDQVARCLGVPLGPTEPQ